MKSLLRLLAPRYRVSAVTELTPARLRTWQIDALMLDLDNTLVYWGQTTPPRAVREWLGEIKRAGIPACVVSNNVTRRKREATATLGLPFAEGRFKPSAAKLRHALAILGTPAARTAMVGDQLFTDVLAGNRLGVPTVLTAPLAPRESIHTRVIRIVERALLAALARLGMTPSASDHPSERA